MAVTLKFDDATDADDALAKHVGAAAGPSPLPGTPGATWLPTYAWDNMLASANGGKPPAPLPGPKTIAAPVAAPKISALEGPPPLAAGGLGANPAPFTLRAPTPTESLQAGIAERGGNAKEELPAAGQPVGAKRPGFWGKLEHGLATAGNIAGNIVAPEEMALIPGTQLHREFEANRAARMARAASENELTQAEAENQRTDAWKRMHPGEAPEKVKDIITDENGKKWEVMEGGKVVPAESAEGAQLGTAPKAAKPPTDQEFMASAAQQLEKGTITPQDRERLAGMQRAAKLQGVAPEVVAQVGDPPVPADFAKGKEDPKYKAQNTAWGKEVERLKNEEAAASGQARGSAYNESRPVQALVPQPDGSMASVWMPAKEAEAGGYSTVPQGTKALSQIAQMNDIVNASEKVRDALKETGGEAFTPTQTAKLTMAMKETDPTVMRNEIANLAASGLSPAQQDLVTWLYQLQERALSLRSIAGMGQGSETTRMAILKALPGITSGNQEMAIKQLDAFDNMVGNLRKGILSVKGNAAGGTGGGQEKTGAPEKKEGKKGDPLGIF